MNTSVNELEWTAHISRTTAQILANRHSKFNDLLRAFDRIYHMNYKIFIRAQLSIYEKNVNPPNLPNLGIARWTVPLHLRCIYHPEGISIGFKLSPYPTYSVQGFPRYGYFYSANMTGCRICRISEVFPMSKQLVCHILGTPARNMLSKESN